MLAQVSHSYRPFVEANDDVMLSADLQTDIAAHTTQFPPADYPMTMAAFKTVHDDYVILVNVAKGGDAAAVAARNQYRTTTWLPAVEKWADFVNIKAAGDPSIILLSGFHATKTTADASVVPVQMTLNGNSTAPGQFNYESKTKVDSHIFTLIGTIAGDVDISQDGNKIMLHANKDTVITLVNTNNKKGTVTGLTSKKDMDWTIVPRNPAGSGPKSPSINIVIQ